MTGYLLLVTGTLFVDGARTVIQTEQNREKVIVGGVCFWIGAAFQFGLFSLPDLGPVWGALFKSGITTGGFAAIAMILYLEFTNPRRMRFQSRLDIEVLPELNQFLHKFADRRGWDAAMKDRLSAVAEETLLTLAPLDLEGLLEDKEEEEEAPEEMRRLVVVASSDGPYCEPGVYRRSRKRGEHRGPAPSTSAARLGNAGGKRNVASAAAELRLVCAASTVPRH